MKKIWLLLIVIVLGGCKMSSDTNEASLETETKEESEYIYQTFTNETDKELTITNDCLSPTTQTVLPNESITLKIQKKNYGQYCTHIKSSYGSYSSVIAINKEYDKEIKSVITLDSFGFWE